MLFLGKEDRKKYLGFDDLWFFILLLPLVGLFVPTAFFHVDFSKGIDTFLWEWCEGSLFAATYWLGYRTFCVFIRKRLPGFDNTVRRIIYTIIFILLFGFFAGAIVKFIVISIHPIEDFTAPAHIPYVATYFTSFFMVMIYEGIYLYAQNKRIILESERLKQHQVKSELQGLRSQVNPHFLFNSLNTLINIIGEDKDLAESFVKKLSNVYRYTLERKDDYLIPMKEELKFIESYIFLQKERFREGLDVRVDISESDNEKFIVPLSLQILFENAIKHNMVSKRSPLRIDVYVEGENKLVVRNNLQRKTQAMPSTKVGLENIRSRYAYFTEDQVEIIENETFFIVKIPLLTEYEKQIEA